MIDGNEPTTITYRKGVFIMNEFQKGMWVRTLWDPVKAQEESPLIGNKEVKVAAYCRVSTDSEKQIHSLENQVNHYTHFIRSKPNWKFVGVYFDNGTSGKNAKKQRGLQRLLRHCKEGRVDFILAKSVSRLSRNAKHLIEIVEELKAQGVGVYFEEQHLDTSIEYNQFLLSTHAALAQEEIEAISNATRWGYEKQFQKGNAKFNQVFGYNRVKKDGRATLEINPEQAAIVRQIYDWYLQKWSYADINRELMKRGIKTARGKDVWQTNTIKAMLQTVTYTGNKLARVHSKSLFSKEGQDHIAIENTHPAIISMDVYEKVQERIESKTKKRTQPPKYHYASFSKRMHCHRCNYRFERYKNRTGVYWQCHPSRIGTCLTPRFREEHILALALQALKSKFDMESPTILEQLKKVLQTTNQQDHFEFHRLKWLSQMEIARATQTEDDVKQMENEYRRFEEQAVKIEDDRPYRIKALEWLNKISTVEDFYEQISLDYTRAWIMHITIENEQDFEVTWLDGTSTTIGQLTLKDEVQVDEPEPPQSQEENHQQKEVTPELTLLDENGDLKDKGESEMNTTIQREVQKIEPKGGEAILQTIDQTTYHYQLPETLRNQARPLRTAAYCRVSTDRLEQASSLKTQVAYYTYFILKNPKYEFAGIYADEGLSGRSMKNRTELQRLIQACEQNEVDLIISKSISRFSRNALDTLRLTRHLKSLPSPVYVYFEKENIWTNDPQADMMLSIFGGIAQEESMNLGSTIAWGVRSQAKRGIIRRKRVNYGYRTDEHYRWHIVEDEAKVVRRIYNEVRQGKTVFQLIKDLSEEGIPSPSGSNKWHHRTVENILKSVVYRGDYLFQQYVTINTAEKQVVRNQGEEPQYYIEHHHEAIIDPEVWEEVQAIIEERERAFAKRKSPIEDQQEKRNQVLKESLYCGVCGSPVSHFRELVQKDGEGFHKHYFVCIRFAKRQVQLEPCDSRYMKQKYFEQQVKQMLKELDITAFHNEATKAIAKIDLNEKDHQEEETIKRNIHELNQELYEAVDEGLHEKGQDSQRVDQITEELCSMYESLKEFRERKKKAEQERNNLKQIMKQLKTEVENPSAEFPEELYTNLVTKAEYFKDGKMIFHLRYGIKRTIKGTYEKYLLGLRNKRKSKTKERHEAIRNSPEVRALLKYCEEPKVWREIYAFIKERMKISDTHFREIVIEPLLEAGVLERYKAMRLNEPFPIFHYIAKGNEEKDKA